MALELVQPLQEAGIPTLATVLDAHQLRPYIEETVVRRREWGRVQEVDSTVLQLHPASRCTVEIGLRTNKGQYSVIGKVYAEDRCDVFRAMGRLVECGFRPEAEYGIPEPLGYVPELRLLLQEKIDGKLAGRAFPEGGRHEQETAAERCARWLAKFHGTAPQDGAPFELAEYLRPLARWSRRIAGLGAPYADKARRLFARLSNAAAFTSGISLSAGHGSYSPAQIIFDSGRTVVFDWDSFAPADPARDVARFLVALRRLALGRLQSIRALDGAGNVFLHTYLSWGRPEALANLRFYQAATCLQLAKYELGHSVSHWEEKLAAMLDEGLRILEQAD